jgi:hypothetical protein
MPTTATVSRRATRTRRDGDGDCADGTDGESTDGSEDGDRADGSDGHTDGSGADGGVSARRGAVVAADGRHGRQGTRAWRSCE